jgi:hypothetical protein
VHERIQSGLGYEEHCIYVKVHGQMYWGTLQCIIIIGCYNSVGSTVLQDENS